MPKQTVRAAFTAPAAKAKPAVPAYEVTFVASQWPGMQIDESEGDMITRFAAHTFNVAPDALLPSPAPRSIGQGEGDSCLFEIFIKASAINPLDVARRADVVSIIAHGVDIPKGRKPQDPSRLKIK